MMSSKQIKFSNKIQKLNDDILLNFGYFTYDFEKKFDTKKRILLFCFKCLYELIKIVKSV